MFLKVIAFILSCARPFLLCVTDLSHVSNYSTRSECYNLCFTLFSIPLVIKTKYLTYLPYLVLGSASAAFCGKHNYFLWKR